MSDQPTVSLASFASSLAFDQISPDLLERLKFHSLDAVGAALYGSATPWARTVTDLLRDESGDGLCTVWGRRFRLPLAAACFANSMATHAFELDDRRVVSHAHPASATLSVALAMAEVDTAITGTDVLLAVLTGYEVLLRVGRCLGKLSLDRGFYPPGYIGSFGAAATAGKLLGFNSDEMTRAFGITATQACGLYSPTHLKRFNIGRGVHGGVVAALLVKRGFEAPGDAFEADVGGLCKALADGCDPSVLAEIPPGEFDTYKVELKPYVSSRPNHVAIDLMLKLRSQRPEVRVMDIETLEIEVGTDNYRYGAGFEVRSVSEALMSVAYCAAVAFIDGEAFLGQFTEEKLSDSLVRQLLASTVVRKNSEFDKLNGEMRDMTRVRVVFRDGSEYRAEAAYATGHPEYPMSADAVTNKYRLLAERVLPGKRVREIERRILNLERERAPGELVQLMAVL